MDVILTGVAIVLTLAVGFTTARLMLWTVEKDRKHEKKKHARELLMVVNKLRQELLEIINER